MLARDGGRGCSQRMLTGDARRVHALPHPVLGCSRGRSGVEGLGPAIPDGHAQIQWRDGTTGAAHQQPRVKVNGLQGLGNQVFWAGEEETPSWS